MILDAGPVSVNPLDFVQLGILGVVFFMLVTGMLWAKPAVDAMQKQHEIDRKLWEERIIPVMEQLAKGVETNVEVTKTNNSNLSELVRILKDRRGI